MPQPTHDEVAAQLARVLSAKRFEKSPRLSAFLAFVVRNFIGGDLRELKEVRIGMEVFGEKDFDPAKNANVRATAVRLRKELAEYYNNEGKDDPVIIEIPKGGYVPAFRLPSPSGQKNSSVAAGGFRAVLPWVAILLLTFGSGLTWRMLSDRRAAANAQKTPRAPRLFALATTEGHQQIQIKTGHSDAHLLVTPDGEKLYSYSPHGEHSLVPVSVRDLRVKRRLERMRLRNPSCSGRGFL